MQFRTFITTLLFYLATIFLGGAIAEDTTSTVTVVKYVDVTSTSYITTVTMYGTPPKNNNQGPMLYEAITTILPNATGYPNATQSAGSAAGKFGTSLGLAAGMGAAAVIVGMW